GEVYTAHRGRHPRDAGRYRRRYARRPLRRRLAEVRGGAGPPARALGVRGAQGR
ncbi:MAG: Glycine dehydrogenase [decarboxylating] (glycine cleavage system P1 protein), partial [uncultured Rubrobacteraceae bacterium]